MCLRGVGGRKDRWSTELMRKGDLEGRGCVQDLFKGPVP